MYLPRKGNDIASVLDPSTAQNRGKVLTPRGQDALVRPYQVPSNVNRHVRINFLQEHTQQILAQSIVRLATQQTRRFSLFCATF